MKNKVTAFSLHKVPFNNIALSLIPCFVLRAPGLLILFWCVHKELLLITTSVSHWFYFCYFWTFDSSWHQKWAPRKPPIPPDSKASEQTGAGTHRPPWAHYFLTNRGVRDCLSWIQAPFSAFWSLQLYCEYLYFVCWSFLVSHPIVFKRRENTIPCVLEQVLENRVLHSTDILGNLKAKMGYTWSMHQDLVPFGKTDEFLELLWPLWETT